MQSSRIHEVSSFSLMARPSGSILQVHETVRLTIIANILLPNQLCCKHLCRRSRALELNPSKEKAKLLFFHELLIPLPGADDPANRSILKVHLFKNIVSTIIWFLAFFSKLFQDTPWHCVQELFGHAFT